MKDYIENRAKKYKQKIIEKKVKVKKKSLIKVLALCASIGAVSIAGAIAPYNIENTPKERESNYELLIQAREIYEKAIQDNTDYQTLRGIESVIIDLEAGKSF